MKHRSQHNGRRALVLADAMMGLAILALATTLLIVSTARSDKAARRLSDARQAARLAEAALSDLEAGQPLPKADSDTTVTFAPMSRGSAITGHHWIQAVVTVRGQQRSLVGLVPDSGAATQPAGGGAR